MARRKMPNKLVNSIEIVERCDKCGKPLRRFCIRTAGSAACAAGDGVSVTHLSVSGKEKWYFFCCEQCMSTFVAK